MTLPSAKTSQAKQKAVEQTCEHCGNQQRVVTPWKHVPRCKNCRKPMIRHLRSQSKRKA